MEALNILGADAILFLIDENRQLLGSITDGDLRRGFISGLSFEDAISKFMQPNPKYILKGDADFQKIVQFRDSGFRIIPVVNENKQIITVINFRYSRSYLPVDGIIMAGGKGERLKPLTDDIPKPMLTVGEKPIIELNIDRLIQYGIDDIWISIRYKGEKIKEYFRDGSDRNAEIRYIEEDDALGTIGAARLAVGLKHDHVLVMNSDLLTNIDFEDFYSYFLESGAEMAVASIPYQVQIPYAVLNIENDVVKGFSEKPSYLYYSNAGIYLMKREIISMIPENKFYNTTELMQDIIDRGLKIVSYPLVGYWLDIGQHEDYRKANTDFNHIKF